MRLKLSKKRSLIVLAGVIILGGLGAATYLLFLNRSPLPASITKPKSFKIIYPSTTANLGLFNASYTYQAGQDGLSFTAGENGAALTITEQKIGSSTFLTPKDSLQLLSSLGVRPYASFESKVGIVALTKFWQTGNLNTLQQSAQTALLVRNNTLLIVHPSKDLSFQDWQDFFSSLKVDK